MNTGLTPSLGTPVVPGAAHGQTPPAVARTDAGRSLIDDYPAEEPPVDLDSLGKVELAFEFARWASRPGQIVDHNTIAQRFGVSRATAYRYLAAWNRSESRWSR